ncbi:hypothetical protein I7I53_11587 [Histoplasma capsulatum var. duboisii H88]|uniref:Uncharacterized protein n=1 Tax=Ajellomyces capsulatus (strain H88) TaxID=544711 RepID=A0A8A1LU15_AJEC8|nr:hypothetical protein I7I53_11587 [Histoplasma capsulatum var. duboisii H88]
MMLGVSSIFIGGMGPSMLCHWISRNFGPGFISMPFLGSFAPLLNIFWLCLACVFCSQPATEIFESLKKDKIWHKGAINNIIDQLYIS